MTPLVVAGIAAQPVQSRAFKTGGPTHPGGRGSGYPILGGKKSRHFALKKRPKMAKTIRAGPIGPLQVPLGGGSSPGSKL